MQAYNTPWRLAAAYGLRRLAAHTAFGGIWRRESVAEHKKAVLQHYPQPEPAVSQVKLVDGPVLSAEGGEWSHRTSAKRKTSTAKKQLDFDVDGAALCILFGILLICNLTILIKGTLFPENPPSMLGITPMVVLSGSMSGEAEEHIEV